MCADQKKKSFSDICYIQEVNKLMLYTVRNIK
jgi:hypothetical protein